MLTTLTLTLTNPKKKFTPSHMNTKYVDGLMIAEAFNLEHTLEDNPFRPLPDLFHARLGLKLPSDKSEQNQMKLNLSKPKFILFNPTINFDFVPEYEILGKDIETVEEMKLLGLIVSNDLSWKSNTEHMIKRANARLWILKRLMKRGMVNIYIKQIRSVLEFGVPVWNGKLTKEDVMDLERIQKSFLHIALGNSYLCYENALDKSKLETLEERRTKLCLSFALKASKHPQTQSLVCGEQPPRTKNQK